MSASLSLSYLSRNWLICMLVLFLVSHRSLGLSSLFFKNYFSFFCFNRVISKLSFSNLHTCFLFDFFCWWRLSFCVFHFIHGILQLQNFFWFFFMTLLCLSLISSNTAGEAKHSLICSTISCQRSHSLKISFSIKLCCHWKGSESQTLPLHSNAFKVIYFCSNGVLELL